MRGNLAERAGRWSAAHWKTATFGWLAFVTVAVVIGQALGTVKLTDSEQSSGEPARAERALSASGLRSHATETVLVRSSTLHVFDARFRAELARVEDGVRPLRAVLDVRSPLVGRSGQIAKDDHAAIVQVDLRGAPETADGRVAPVLARVAALQRVAPGFTISEFGDASAHHELEAATGSDFSHAEGLTLPVTFLVLLLAFGAFVAAGVPVLLAFSAVLASLGLAAAASHLVHASGATSSVLLLIGMAVGVDYSLFYLKREREERRGAEPGEALARAAATSGRAVLVSGTTVLIAMAGMLLAGSKIFASIGVGAMIVVLVTMAGSITVLPALLGRLGDRVERGVLAVIAATLLRLLPRRRQPRTLVRLRDRRTLLQRLRRVREGAGSSRAWDAVLGVALRRPAVAALGTCALLVVLAIPAVGMHTRLMTYNDLPHGLKAVTSYEQIQRSFPGTPTPAIVVVQAPDVNAPPLAHAIARLRALAAADPLLGGSGGAAPLQLDARHDLAKLEIPLAGDGADSRSYAALSKLRRQLLPSTIGRVPGASYAVTGQMAGTLQFNEVTKSHWPLVFAFVLGLAFLLLTVTFRSIVIGATAIVLNLLSVGAAYGVLVWVFQDGHLQGLLGFHSSGAIVTWLPLFMFAVLFGLSMDYHVFIVSRIKELADRGVPTEQAVARGIAGTAGTVTAAAAVMVAVFAVFATVSTLEIKQMGVGLAVAVLIDATVIRAVLLPAAMKLLGPWNWYLPSWLRWLPKVRSERGAGRSLPEVG